MAERTCRMEQGTAEEKFKRLIMSDSTASRQIESIQAPIAALPQIYSTLRALASRLGSEESKWQEICLRHVEAECELCGIKITGQELAEVANANPAERLSNPKLQRLGFHYCARNSCDCRFYRINFLPHPEVDWSKVKRELEGSTNLLPADAGTKSGFHFQWNVRIIAGAAGGILAATVLLVLLHHWIYGGRIPLFQERHHYSAEPQPHLR